MGMKRRLISAAAGVGLGLQAATQLTAWAFAYSPALGPRFTLSPDAAVFPPWAVLAWRPVLTSHHPQLAQAGAWLILVAGAGGLALGMMLESPPGAGGPRWGGWREARRAGLAARSGCILGELRGRLLATEDLRPTLVTGGTRSGKGRGHVAPTLLSWRQSVLVHDPKGELWPLTAGYRASFSHALFFDPRSAAGARWNPLAEITPGPSEMAQIQRLVAILSDPAGLRSDEAIWDKAACEILEAVILHVLYAAPDEKKTLLGVREMLADLDASAETMLRTHHRQGADGTPECHPFVALAVRGYASMHDRFRTSVQGTARSYLKWLAGEDLERALSASDIRLGDLMCAERPVSLYVQLAPADAAALRPLVRLIFHAATQVLTTAVDHDAEGRPKRHRLLLAMDEFPLLGRVEFFEKSLRLMSGYGLKAMFVAQSLNDISESYGPHNTILDNCHVFTAFSALDPLTQDKVSRLTGTEQRSQVSRSAPQFPASGRATVTISEAPRLRLSPGDIGALDARDQLIFSPGGPPILARKLRYDRREPFRSRSRLPPPDQSTRIDAPPQRPHPWLGRRPLGEDNQALPLRKEVEAAITEKRVSALVAEATAEYARQYLDKAAALDHLQGLAREKD